MKWNKVSNNDIINDEYDLENTPCLTCREKALKVKLEKIKMLNEYQRSQQEMVILEEIEKQLRRIEKEKESQIYIFLCKKHKNVNSNSI